MGSTPEGVQLTVRSSGHVQFTIVKFGKFTRHELESGEHPPGGSRSNPLTITDHKLHSKGSLFTAGVAHSTTLVNDSLT